MHPAYYENKQTDQTSGFRQYKPLEDIICFKCGEKGVY